MTKIKIEIKNRWTGKVLFEYEKEDNTIKDTLIEAVKQKANLSGADLRGANLSGADLRGAYLSDANLSGADLSDANLSGADLSDADLRDANLSDANLRDAILRGADLSDANLRDANLRGAYLSGAYLRGANLRGADLSDANLSGADLSDANLSDANLSGADLSDAKEIPFVPFACPSDGAFIGWKKVRGCLVQLEIPADARRQSAIGTKCRCDKAKVLSIVDINTNKARDKVTNIEYAPLDYIVGEMVYPDSFDDNRWEVCSHGIHFFINKQEAIDY